MTLQQRIKASAQELIRLLEESDSEYQDFLKDRDARLGIGDPWEPDRHPLEFKVIMGKLDNGKPFTRSIRSEQPASAHKNYRHELRRLLRLQDAIRTKHSKRLLSTDTPLLEYHLQGADGRDFERKVLIERAKTTLESFLCYLAPQRTFIIGFDGGQAYDICDEPDLANLKELGYKVIFKVTPQPDRYLISEVM